MNVWNLDICLFPGGKEETIVFSTRHNKSTELKCTALQRKNRSMQRERALQSSALDSSTIVLMQMTFYPGEKKNWAAA